MEWAMLPLAGEAAPLRACEAQCFNVKRPA